MKPNWMAKAALGVAVVALSLGASYAQAGPGRWRHGPGGGGPGMERIAQALDLTADQRASLRQIRAKYMGGALGNDLDAMRQAREKLRTVVRDPSATDDQVRAAANAVAAQVAAVALERHHMAAEVSAVLTPEQRAKAAELRQHGKDRLMSGGPGEF